MSREQQAELEDVTTLLVSGFAATLIARWRHRGRAYEAAQKAVSGVRVLLLCERVRLGTSLQLREYPKPGPFP